MSDTYCPPPDSSDYLQNGIEYPVPEGKESTRATDLTHNDINFDDPKTSKVQRSVVDSQQEALKARALKARQSILRNTSNDTNKSVVLLRAPGSRTGKINRSLLPSQYNVARKAVNEI